MWGHDPQRRASMEEDLPATLHLQWTLEFPEPRPAWPSTQPKLQFDRLYEPIVGGGKVFVGSMVRDKLCAYDLASGKELWATYVGGPIRFAPVYWKDTVLFVSDDGYLYSLSAGDGQVRWRSRGGLSDRRVLGHDRLISTWPARGAPVVFDGIAYFGAGLWPFAGVFLHALDADTGKAVWTNSGTGSSFLVQQHNSPAFAGPTPQGYIAATEKRLIVAGGRTVPSVYDRETGEFTHFNVQSREMGTNGGGGYDVAVGKDFILNRREMYDLADGAFVAKVDAPVLTDHAMIGVEGDILKGFRPGFTVEETKDRRGAVTRKFAVNSFWSATLRQKVSRVFFRAGTRVYASAEGNTVLAVDLPRFDSGAEVSWSRQLPDQPLNMIGACGKLLVSTDKGRIYCFGGEPRGLDVLTTSREQLIAKGATWRYRDEAEPPPSSWVTLAFDDSSWPSGPAKLGYGDGNEATKLQFGPDPKKKRLTAWFRHEFELPAGGSWSDPELGVLVDDGCVIYLNEEEVGRFFMPGGDVTPSTLATQGTDENTYQRFSFDPRHLRPGRNVLAIEVHQTSPESSDLCLDVALTAHRGAQAPAPAMGKDAWTARAARILEESGSRDGYAVVLGLGTGRLAEELAVQSKLHVIVLDPDPAAVDAFRRRADALGLYGARVAAVVASPQDAELPPYLAEIVTCEEPERWIEAGGPEGARWLFERLRPYSGVACLALREDAAARFSGLVAEARLEDADLVLSKDHALLRRRRAPRGSGEWTHQYANAANTVASTDERVKAPLGLLWFGGPSHEEVLPRHGHGPTPQVAGGRCVIEGRDMLRATDIYTGRLLWQRQLKDLGKLYDNTSHEPGANAIGSNYVTLDDSVYVLLEKACLRLNPATGETTSSFVVPPGEDQRDSPELGFVAVWEDRLILGAEPRAYQAPDYTERLLGTMKAEDLKSRAEAVATWVGFQAIERVKDQSDAAYLAANLNKLLLEDDMVARIPAVVRAQAKADDLEKQIAEYIEADVTRSSRDYPALLLKRELLHKCYGVPRHDPPAAGKTGSELRLGSRRLACLDRLTGTLAWSVEAVHQFRHNAIVAGSGKVFTIDRLADSETSLLKRRGLPLERTGRVLALDVRTGAPLWSVTKDVRGTWLGYSEAHDILLEAASSGRDRASDEPEKGLRALRGATGEVLWTSGDAYSGPCLLIGERIITQGSATPGFAMDIRTGKRILVQHPVTGLDAEWKYIRQYGCNTALGCPNLLTFRSAAAGYFDLGGDGGTGNFGGFRSGCTSNLIPAGGILCAPDYTRTCTCAYQNQSSLALIHDPQIEQWTFSGFSYDGGTVKRVGLNFGAPGDRRAPDGTLWLDAPSVGGPSPDLPCAIFMDKMATRRHHEGFVESGELAWVDSSRLEGEGDILVRLVSSEAQRVPGEGPGQPALLASGGCRTVLEAPAGGLFGGAALNRGSLVAGGEASVELEKGVSDRGLTIEFWVKTDKDAHFVDGRSGPENKSGLVIDARSVKARYFVQNARRPSQVDEERIESKERLPDNEWTHVAFTYDPVEGRGLLYVGGKLVGSNDGTDGRRLVWGGPTARLRLLPDGGATSFIDELRIVDRPLSPGSLLVAKDAPRNLPGVKGWWRMEPRTDLARAEASSPSSEGSAASGGAPSDADGRQRYDLRLFFAEVDDLAPGDRVFDVDVQGAPFLRSFDIAREAGGSRREVVRELRGVPVEDFLSLTLRHVTGALPVISGLELTVQTRSF